MDLLSFFYDGIMPPRSVIVVVVLFWLASSVWLFQREIQPRLASGESPLFALAHDDDKKQERISATWTAYYKPAGSKLELPYRIQTTVVHHDKRKEDLFELVAHMRPASDQRTNFLQIFHLGDLETTYRVRRHGLMTGRMVGIKATVAFHQGSTQQIGDQIGEFESAVRGERYQIDWNTKNQKKNESGTLDEDASLAGAILMPLHPLESMPGLRPGQRWELHALDPLAATLTSSAQLIRVNAKVREESEILNWEKNDYRCRIVDFSDTKSTMEGTIWVEAAAPHHKVLRMKVRLVNDEWEIIRGYDTDRNKERNGS